MRNVLSRAKRFLTGNFIWLGLCSLVWLIFRSGLRPSRLRYPCQQAALASSSLLVTGYALPGFAAGLKKFGLRMPKLSRRAKLWAGLSIAAAIVIAFSASRISRPVSPVPPLAGAASLPSWTARMPDPSHIFVIDSFPNPDTALVYHEGLDSLFTLLARNGVYLYKSPKPLPWCDTSGIIGKNDVVLLKVNAEWDQRGQTNGDVIKGVIARIVAHPDTFTGEVELVENGQWRQSWTYAMNNAEDTTQTMQSIVDEFAAQGWHVGAYNWTAIGYGGNNRWVSEYDQADTISGYVREDSSGMTYPKFMTRYGTQVSVRRGVWNGSGYEPERLKFFNMPVLKSHSLMGVSSSVKHYIGFLSYAAIGSGTMHTRAMTQGLLGVDFGKARFPDLNIIDATWVMAEGTAGPNAPYNLATRRNILVASKDPIANDYYAGRYVIRPVSWWNGHPWLHNYGRMDPDNLNTENPGNGNRYAVDSTPCGGMPYNAFHQMLVSSRDKMLAYGRHVTMDTLQMSVHIISFRPQTGVFEPGGETSPISVLANPARDAVVLQYALKAAGPVKVSVFDTGGRLVCRLKDAVESAGEHRLVWNRTDDSGRLVPAGTYVVVLETAAGRSTRKVVIFAH